MMRRLRGIWLVIAAVYAAISVPVTAQTPVAIHVSFEETSLDQAINTVSAQTGVQVVYSPDMIPDVIVDRSYEGDVEQILMQLLEGTGLAYEVRGNQIVLIRPVIDQTPFVVSGYVQDKETGERLIGAHVYDIGSRAGAITNEYGFFSIQTRGNSAALKTSYLGYQYDTLTLLRKEANESSNIELDRLLVLREVVIQESETREINVIPLTGHHFNERQLASRTYLGGEWDVQRYMEGLPGVSIGIDGIGGLHVRGGNSDQNLILLDGVPLYYATHALGVLSVFNPLMIREVNLEKGDFPARYAGRLSSVLDVRTKEGSQKKWSFQAGIGPTTVNGLVEGPIVKDKIGVLVSARRFVPGFYIRELSRDEKEADGATGQTDYVFTDLNAKLNITVTPKDRVYLSLYHGEDSYDDLTGRLSTGITPDGLVVLQETFTRRLNWGNTVGALRWNHQFGKNIFANATFTVSGFELRTLDYGESLFTIPNQADYSEFVFVSREFKSKINDTGIRLDFDHYISNSHRLRYGAAYTKHTISPKSIVFDDEARVDSFYIDEGTLDDQLFSELVTTAVETGLYLEDELQLGKAFTLAGGLHFSGFHVREKQYWSLQPRLGANILILPTLSANVSTGFMTQYLHLLTSSGIGLPTDLWVPSTADIKPQKAFQTSAGMSWQATPRIALQFEAYYRKLNNLTTYEEGASFLYSEGSVATGIVDAANWENKVTQGDGNAVGIEIATGYKGKRTIVDVAYTWSKSNRTFPELNFGKTYPFRFDRRHAVSFSGAFQISRRFFISAAWNYASGVPITLAESRILSPSAIPGLPAVEYLDFSERNAFRLPSYHRLDIGAKYIWKRPKAQHTIQLDFYNVYNRDNILYVTLVKDGNAFVNRQFTVLPFIPSLSYYLKI